jgi:hypothetical protein
MMLWSWYANDDFRFLKGNDVGVAYLALSLDLQGKDDVVPYPREYPMRANSETYQMAVVRLNFSGSGQNRTAFSEGQRLLVLRMIGEIQQLAHARAIQVDFDAPKSAWPFYQRLLEDLRKKIGPDIFLSITALVSWCDSTTSWLGGLPVDEIVPMAFSMGQASPATITMLTSGGQFALAGCRTSLGIGLAAEIQYYSDNPSPPGFRRAEPGRSLVIHPKTNQRAYFFPNASAWTPTLLSKAKGQIQP